MTSIWPNKNFNIDISKLSKLVNNVSQSNDKYSVSFKKPYTKLTYQGYWDTSKKKPNGKGKFSLQNTPIVLDITFKPDGTLDSTTEGTLVQESYIYQGHFNDQDDWGSSNIFIHGKGKLIFKNHSKNDVYEGNFSKNDIQGEGTMTYLNGASNSGTWQNGKLNGPVLFNHLSMEISNMSGNWKDGKPHDGFCYDEIVIEKKRGEKLVNASYTGFWKQGKTFGPGQLIKTNNEKNTIEKHIGLFIDNKLFSPERMNLPLGQHVKIYENEQIFEYYNGEWQDGKKNGLGVQFFGKSGISIYNGEWKDNIISGDGSSIYNPTKNEDGSYNIDSIYPIYVGKWDDNKQNGFGILLFDKPTKPIIQDNKIINIENLRSKIGKWQDNIMVQGFELNKTTVGDEKIYGEPLNKIKKEDIPRLHASIQNIIKANNNDYIKESFINSHLDIAKVYIDDILDKKVHGLTYEQSKELSIKHYFNNYRDGILERSIDILTMLQLSRLRKGGRKTYRKNYKKRTRKLTRKGGKDPILKDTTQYEKDAQKISQEYQVMLRKHLEEEAKRKREEEAKRKKQIKLYNEIIDKIKQKQSEVTEIVKKCIKEPSKTCSIPQSFETISNKISKLSNAKLLEKAEYESKKIIYLNIQLINYMIKLKTKDKENTPNKDIIKILKDIIKQLKKHPLAKGYNDSEIYEPPSHMPIEITESSL